MKAVIFLLMTTAILNGCTGIPDGIKPVQGVEVERYLGSWYEIARLDHSFERGLINVTARYSMGNDGGIKVVNSGYDSEKKEWKRAEGRAYFIEGEGVGRLKVSFFGPFYGGYNIIALDRESYEYVMVCGYSRDYLWIMARRPELPRPLLDKLLYKAESLGFDTKALIWPQKAP